MSYLTESDYNDLKSYTLSELESYLKEIEDTFQSMTLRLANLRGEEMNSLMEEMDEFDAWITAYKNEINLRMIPSTPNVKPNCDACENGKNNQEGPCEGCLPTPAWMLL